MKVIRTTATSQQNFLTMPTLQRPPIHYHIRHHTRFRYTAPITESYMEVRMEPLSDSYQQCHSFKLTVNPPSRILAYQDQFGNQVSHFNVLVQHDTLTIKTETVVDCYPRDPLPAALTSRAWPEIDALKRDLQFWDFLSPSHFAQPTPLLLALAEEMGLDRRMEPLTLLRWLNTAVYEHFDYVPSSTQVDSPIDHALEERQGVCQDFTHIMIALVRLVGIPCRYVSGYLFHRDHEDRSLEDASHAWMEAMLPDLGWVGFDPTNNLIANERHIRTAVGRDYADVPPTHGVFRGNADSELDVGVQVTQTDAPPVQPKQLIPETEWHAPMPPEWQQQQQQQQ